MKKFSVKKTFSVLCAVLLILSVFASCAAAESAKLTFTAWKDRLLSVQSFKFQRHKEGLKLGLTSDVPVYTAPSMDALRLANGHAACDTNMELYEAGYTDDGWLLVRYDPGNGKIRTGYIPPKYCRKNGFRSSMSQKGFDSLSAVAAGTIAVTDNPKDGGSAFAELADGDSFRILAKYTYGVNWWYIELTVDGKTARGFISRDTSSFYPGEDVEDHQTLVNMETIGTPSVSPLGTAQECTILINGNKGDERKKVHRDADPNSGWVSVVYPTNTYPCYGSKVGTTGKTWYYVFIESDSMFGWISGAYCTLQ